MKLEKAPFIIAFLMVMIVARITVSSADKNHPTLTGQGELMSLDIDRGNLLVEVPLNGQLYTVAGKLSQDTLIKKEGVITNLTAFKVGDTVKIGWQKTPQGHHIKFIESVKKRATLALKGMYYFSPTRRVIGYPDEHVIDKRETLLDIAREYGLGINDIQDLYPQLDPWIPPEGKNLVVPTQWILPDEKAEGIVINVAEFRMFYFPKNHNLVKTYPLGLGDTDWTTPLGTYKITEKEINPTWAVPPSLRHKYKVRSIPPGPENPLGEYWMGLGNTSYGIHGSDIPWSVGRLVTHGCIRMYPEDIEELFNMVNLGTPVKLIYEPVKIGLYSGRIFVEVHKDVYNRIEDFSAYGFKRLEEKGLTSRVNIQKFRQALERQDGTPWDVTKSN